MEKPTYTDILRMEDVLLDARHILAEAELVARGEKVRITFYPEYGEGPFSHCYPVRVAEYARQVVIRAQAPLYEVARVSFTTYGCTVAYLPTVEGYRAFIQVLLAHSCAEQRRLKREVARAKQGQKGGQSA